MRNQKKVLAVLLFVASISHPGNWLAAGLMVTATMVAMAPTSHADEPAGSVAADAQEPPAGRKSRLPPAPAKDAAAQVSSSELIRRLAEGEPDARAAAAEMLGKREAAAKDAIPALMAALKDQDRLPDGRFVGMVASDALGDIGPDALPQLLAGLTDRSQLVWVGAASAIARMGPRAKSAVPRLIVILDENDPERRTVVIAALQGIGPPAEAAVPSLMKMLDSDDFHTQYWACRALGAIGPAAKPAVPVLCRLTKKGPPSVRRNAAATLGQIGPAIGREGLDALVAAVSDRMEPVREDAVVALGNLREFAAPARPTLCAALEGNKIACRVAVAIAIWRITGDADAAVSVLVKELDNVDQCERAAEALAEIGPPAKAAVPALTKQLAAQDTWMKILACRALGRIGSAAGSAVPNLQKLLKDEEPEVRQEADAAIRQIGAASGAP